ncbi:MAG: tetraacyldisaccharide 4-kinase [Acidobacteriota bacterium]|nr:tetraacyldisaccharide 4-kinase [Acidobacteriota bacterium]
MTSLSQIALAPLGAAYGAIVRARLALYRRGHLRVMRVGGPVLSVGNLTAGGTGKTPLVEWLAREIAKREGLRVCILTRGYGRADVRRRVVVSDGARVLADAREAGDEPLLLAERLLAEGVAVVCDADRAAAARFALAELHSEVFILDDGFQHLRVERDLNIVALDATDPWGGGRLLPAGLLREPIRELSRADCVIVTRAELSKDLEGLCADASRLSGGRPVFTARTRMIGARLLARAEQSEGVITESGQMLTETKETLPLAQLPRAVAAFCGVGNPRAFFLNLKGEGFELKRARSFADHRRYTRQDVMEIEVGARSVGAQALLTTAKDAVKLRALRFALPCYAVEIELRIDEEEELLEFARKAIADFDKRRL